LQARNSARVIISGSLQLFSDTFFTSFTDNQYFSGEITKWAFKERGILLASNITHNLVGQSTPPFYTVKDKIEYSVTIQEWNGQKWIPFISDKVQLEFTMLDPYVRVGLKPVDKGRYTAQLVVPDVYGIYSFKVDYYQLGYTALHLKDIHPVRPFLHNQYPRFLTIADPYYVASVSMLLGVFVLSIALLFSK